MSEGHYFTKTGILFLEKLVSFNVNHTTLKKMTVLLQKDLTLEEHTELAVQQQNRNTLINVLSATKF